MLGPLLDLLSTLKGRVDALRLSRRWRRLRKLGMHIGGGVNLPASTFIDTSHCFLISVGDWCGFGEGCVLLAHDGQFDEFLDAGRIGRVVIHPHSHLGTRTIVLAGVEIGPRTIVGAGSVVTRSLPPDTVCAGNPARVITSLDEYLARHREALERLPKFDYLSYDIRFLTPERKAELVAATASTDAYITGGFTATLGGLGGMRTTAFDRTVVEARGRRGVSPPA
jgi:maltose O-acetyltransferase